MFETPEFSSVPPAESAVPVEASAVPSARSFDAGAVTPVGSVPGAPQNPPDLSSPGTRPRLAPQPPAASNSAATARIKHSSMIGEAFKAIAGHEHEYRINPETGQTEAIPVKQTPGSLFRHILAGALVGAAAGSKEKRFAAGLGEGAKAENDVLDKQDRQRYQRAQDQFKNQQEIAARKDRKTLLNAQVAHYNALTLHENMLATHENFDFNQKVSAAGAARMSPYREAGIQMAATDVPESQMHDMIKKRPEMSTYHWEPTGVKVVAGEPGKDPHYELTYSAVDPNEKVKVTQDLINQFKKDGMEKYYPNLDKVLKAGQSLDPQDYLVMVHKDKELANENYLRSKQNVDIEKEKALTKESNARAFKDRAEANRANRKDQQERQDSEINTLGWSTLRKNDYDVEKTVAELQSMAKKGNKKIGDVGKFLKDFDAGLRADREADIKELQSMKSALDLGDADAQARAKEIYAHAAALRSISDQLRGMGAVKQTDDPLVAVQIPGQPVGHVLQSRLDAFMKTYPNARRVGKTSVSDSVDQMVSGYEIPLDKAPDLSAIPEGKVLYTDGKGKYTVRPGWLHLGDQWRKIGVGTQKEEPQTVDSNNESD